MGAKRPGKGGARKGAGRKPRDKSGPLQRISVYLPRPILAWLEAQAEDQDKPVGRLAAEIIERVHARGKSD